MHKSRLGTLVIDCQTDDLEAEVGRREGLGASAVETMERWTVMQARAGTACA